MENDAIKNFQFLVSRLMEQLESLTLENKAYKRVTESNPAIQSAVADVLAGPQFVSVRKKVADIRKQVLQAAADQDTPEIFGALGELLGTLRQA